MESETSHEVMKSTTNTPNELTQPHSFRENPTVQQRVCIAGLAQRV